MGKYTTDSCLALGPEVVAQVCEEVGLRVERPYRGRVSEESLSHNLKAVENSDVVVFGVLEGIGELHPTSLWLLGYAVAKGKTVLGWLNIEEERQVAWMGSNPLVMESAFVVSSKESLAHALVTVRDAGREITETVRKKKDASH